MKIIRLKNHLTVVLDDASVLTHTNCTDALYNDIMGHQTDEEYVKKLLIPTVIKKEEEIKEAVEMLDNFSKSKYLTVCGESVYLKQVSELTMPTDLVKAFYKAEQDDNQELIDTYINFWTHASSNPDSRARHNLFWFLNKYGMTISKSGLFIAFRNVKVKKKGNSIDDKLVAFVSSEFIRVRGKFKKSPKHYTVGKIDGQLIVKKDADKLDENLGNLQDMYLKLSGKTSEATVYTDQHSGRTTIKIGEIVSIPREECDSVQENTCSRGLHVAGKDWLTPGYFGTTLLMVLVNPADVVAVPPSDSYGKMRTCAYYPVQVVEFGEDGKIVNLELEDGFEDDFIEKIHTSVGINNEDNSHYKFEIPNIPELKIKNITKNLDKIREQLAKRNAN